MGWGALYLQIRMLTGELLVRDPLFIQFQVGPHLANDKCQGMQIQVVLLLGMQCQGGHHLAKGLPLLMPVLDGLHPGKGQHQDVRILVMWRPLKIQACQSFNS
ncbi:Uncharacterized protein TCM_006802 [Theobroma cacao]|uniref:Uncharacterized protein n=1 Tax=Theobroma cacao TaxID=3641 RepID=A0A061DYU3_THECC|nr:Uncharacterized protein TCM_006802 [Theobroma cacao]